MERPGARRLLTTALKYAVGLGALWWLLGQVETGEVLRLLGRLDATTLLALVAVTVAGLLARFFTWQATVRPIAPLSVRAAGSVDLTVNFVNQLLPSRLSGRVAAPFILRSRTGLAYPDAAAVSVVHTGVYAVLYGLVAGLGLLLFLGRVPLALLALLVVSTGLYLAAGVVVLVAGTNLSLLDPVVTWLADRMRRVPRVGAALGSRIESLPEFTEASTDAVRALATDPGVWARYAVGWTGALVLAPGARVSLLLGAFGAGFEPALLLPVYLVTAYSVTLLPLTPGGIGVTEATATAVFVALGVPSAVIVPVVFIDRVLGVYLPALCGWYPSLKIDLSALS